MNRFELSWKLLVVSFCFLIGAIFSLFIPVAVEKSVYKNFKGLLDDT